MKVFAEQSARLYQEGYTQYSRGKYKEALKAFETSLKMNPENVDSMYLLPEATTGPETRLKPLNGTIRL